MGENFSEFFDARAELFRHEAGEAGREAAVRSGAAGVIVVCAVMTWLLVNAGLIGWLATVQGAVPWYGLALIFALLHLALATLAALRLRKKAPPFFRLTKQELTKDFQWLKRVLKNDE